MCTVSWRHRSGGYDLFFNRDELNTRAPESAPFIDELNGVRFVAPRDGDHRGTWLLANEHGITVCLLNDYANAWRPPLAAPYFSRGHIVLATASVRNSQEVVARVEGQPLAHTAPFHLLVLSAGENPLHLHWHGAGLARREGEISPPMFTSSSFATSDVVAARLQHFYRCVARPEQPELAELTAFHRQHDPAAGAFSVAMRRPGAATRSHIRVSVVRRSVALSYERAHWSHEVRTAPRQFLLKRRAEPAASVA